MAEETKRILMLGDKIKGDTVKPIIEAITQINYEDQLKESKLKDYKRDPIQLLINTPGGFVYDGWGLVGAIEMSNTPVHTIAMGWAMSMGFVALLAGHKRFAYRRSTIMYHEISSDTWGKLTELRESLEETARLMAMYDDYILSRTNITQDKLQEITKAKREWYITPDEALKLGIIDEVLGKKVS